MHEGLCNYVPVNAYITGPQLSLQSFLMGLCVKQIKPKEKKEDRRDKLKCIDTAIPHKKKELTVKKKSK